MVRARQHSEHSHLRQDYECQKTESSGRTDGHLAVEMAVYRAQRGSTAFVPRRDVLYPKKSGGLYFFPHRAFAAFRAIALLCSGGIALRASANTLPTSVFCSLLVAFQRARAIWRAAAIVIPAIIAYVRT